MRTVFLLALVSFVPAGLAAQGDGSVTQAVQSITPEDIAHRIGVLAHDSMRGRNTPSPEIEQTARYIAGEFARFGLEPGGDDGTFIQHYPLTWLALDLAAAKVAVRDGPTWRFGTDVARRRGSTEPEGVTGSTIVIWGTPRRGGALGELSLEGKVVLLVIPMTSGGRAARAAAMLFRGAARQNPAAVILITQPPDQAWQERLRRQDRRRLSIGWREQSQTPIIEVRDATIAPLLEQHGLDLTAARANSDADLMARPLPELELTVTMPHIPVEQASAPNVVGILEGSDPVLKNEYIVYSGHMDHLGVGRPVNGDSIYNGADDDASGTVAVIELAEAFARLGRRPKRSMIFLTVSGEEKGLWGSDYFSTDPAVPVEQIVANLNTDMIGRNWTDTVVVIGKEHSDLGATLDAVAARHPELNITPIDDIWPEERFYFRSDHYNFAKRGVPILFFFSGTHEDYHRLSDHVEKIDAEKESRIVKLVFYLALEVANAAERPQWNPQSYAEIVERGGR